MPPIRPASRRRRAGRARRPRGPEHRNRAQPGAQEIVGEADITSLLQVLDSGAGDERQYFYLGRISTSDFAVHTGPEFGEPGRGTHGLEHDVVTEQGGDRFLRRLVAVRSPCGETVWLEGADEADTAGG